MLSVLIPYRDRQIDHVRNCLQSFDEQEDKNFKVHFIDYGSHDSFSPKAQSLCYQFSFVEYICYAVQDQPWNKAKALNSVIKHLESEFCLIADVDMIFRQDFIAKARSLQDLKKCVYFQVGFLSSKESVQNKKFFDFSTYRKSNGEATGISLLPVEVLKDLKGFDEFYHFWGAEDTDLHVRLENIGLDIEFYEKEVMVLHQWHSTYRLEEKSKLSEKLQINGIVALNHQILKSAKKENRTAVNPRGWGEIPSEKTMQELYQKEVGQYITNERNEIEELLYRKLPQLENGIFKVQIKAAREPITLKYRIKKVLKMKVKSYYSLKEINDRLLLHLISFHRQEPYYYKVRNGGSLIEFAIRIS